MPEPSQRPDAPTATQPPVSTRGGDGPTPPLLLAAASVSALAVGFIFCFLLWFSLPLLGPGRLTAVLSWSWRPFHGEFGILPMVAGSFFLSLSALALAYPLALGLCCFAHGLGPARAARIVMALIRFMTGVPTVVYGLASVFVLVPLVRGIFGGGSGFCWLAAALILALLVLPTIVLLMDGQMREVSAQIRLTAAALGLSRAQELAHLTLPLSSRGLALAAILGFGRAVGDTIVPLMLAGNAAQIPASPLDSIRTLTAHIALVVATDSQSAAYDSLFACGLILFALTLAVNLALRSIRTRAAEGDSRA